MPVCTRTNARFRPLGRRRIDTGFEGGNITSDGGALFVRELDEQIGLSRRISERITDPRRLASCDHACRDLIRQRLIGLTLGYEDLNDHDTLRDDILVQAAVGRDRRLACRTTLGRFERRIINEETARELQALLVELFIEEHDEPPTRLVLDFDATDDVVHGQQEGRSFNAYYDAYIFLPLYVFCGPHPLIAWLRPGSDGAAGGVEDWLRWLVERLRPAWPGVEIVFRGDSGFAKPAIYRCCEELKVEYVIGIGKNTVLLRKSEAWMDTAETVAAEAEDGKARVFGEFAYRAGTWRQERRIIAKAEHNGKGANPRFVVTSLEDSPQALYEKIYCARGDMENRIKEQQLDLFADRTSSTNWWTNQLRLLYSTFAYILLDRLRRRFLGGTELARVYVGTSSSKSAALFDATADGSCSSYRAPTRFRRSFVACSNASLWRRRRPGSAGSSPQHFDSRCPEWGKRGRCADRLDAIRRCFRDRCSRSIRANGAWFRINVYRDEREAGRRAQGASGGRGRDGDGAGAQRRAARVHHREGAADRRDGRRGGAPRWPARRRAATTTSSRRSSRSGSGGSMLKRRSQSCANWPPGGGLDALARLSHPLARALDINRPD